MKDFGLLPDSALLTAHRSLLTGRCDPCGFCVKIFFPAKPQRPCKVCARRTIDDSRFTIDEPPQSIFLSL